jgi:excisionase family DNA binding protein
MKRPAFIAPADVADALDMSRRQVYRWIKAGKLPTVQAGRAHKISEAQLAEAVGEDAAAVVFDAAAEARAEEASTGDGAA